MRLKNRIAVLEGKGKARIIERQIESIQDDEVLIKIEACNLCTSEYGIYAGSRSATFPYMFGHEWKGVVVKVGENVDNFKIGDDVVGCYEFEARNEAALLGDSGNAPRRYSFTQVNEDGYAGRFRGCAQYLVQKAISTFHISNEITPSEAAFLEPLATVVNGMKRLNLKPTDNVLVIGSGTMGILNALLAKVYGCNVYQSELMPKKVNTAKELGINIIDVLNKDPIETIKKESKVDGFDVVIVAVGVTEANKQAFKLLKKDDGKILLFAAGFPEPELGVGSNELHYRKISLIGTYTANYQDFLDASKLLSNKKIEVSKLIEKKIPFENIDEAFQEACKLGAFRVSIVF